MPGTIIASLALFHLPLTLLEQNMFFATLDNSLDNTCPQYIFVHCNDNNGLTVFTI